MPSKVFLKLLFFLIFFIGVLPYAHSTTKPVQNSNDYFLDYEKLSLLQSSQKIAYLKTIQNFLVSSDFSQNQNRKAAIFIRFFLSTSHAAAAGTPSFCVSSGNILAMTKDKGGSWSCPLPPPSKTCKAGEYLFPCNPDFFGVSADKDGKPIVKSLCANPASENPSKKCSDIADAPEDIIKSWDNEKTAHNWANFKKMVDKYCASFSEETCKKLAEKTRALNAASKLVMRQRAQSAAK